MREGMRQLFQMHSHATMHAAQQAGVQPVIEFLEPGDPRRRPIDAEAVSSFAPGYAGQEARAQQAAFGTPATPQGSVTITVPAESVAGLFEQGAFRQPPQGPRALPMTAHQADQAYMQTMSYTRQPAYAPTGAMYGAHMGAHPGTYRRRTK